MGLFLYIKKYWYLFLLFFVFLFWKTIRGFFRKEDKVSSEEKLLNSSVDSVNSSGGKVGDDGLVMTPPSASYSVSEYVAMANTIENALLSSFTEDEEAAMAEVLKCKNSIDWNCLVSEFGMRKPWGVFRDMVSLSQALREYLSNDDYIIVRNHIRGIGGVI